MLTGCLCDFITSPLTLMICRGSRADGRWVVDSPGRPRGQRILRGPPEGNGHRL